MSAGPFCNGCLVYPIVETSAVSTSILDDGIVGSGARFYARCNMRSSCCVSFVTNFPAWPMSPWDKKLTPK